MKKAFLIVISLILIFGSIGFTQANAESYAGFHFGNLTAAEGLRSGQAEFFPQSSMVVSGMGGYGDPNMGNHSETSRYSAQTIGCNISELIDAINFANTNPGPDTIELSPGCEYQVTEIDNITKEYDSNNAFPVITSEIIINGNGATIWREFRAHPRIRMFHISEHGILNLNNVTISGGISIAGGAILNRGTLFINTSKFTKNAGDFGGTILSTKEITINNSMIYENQGSTIWASGKLNISNSNFYNNFDKNDAGAIFILQDTNALIYNTTFYKNTACCCPHNPNVGGAINNKGMLTLINVTIVNNSAGSSGGGLYNHPGGTIVLKNSIIANNIDGGNCGGEPVIDGGGNLRWPSSDLSCVGAFGDPKLGELSDNGGSTLTLPLLPDSAAINAGDNSICSASPIHNLDQRGYLRPVGTHCDIGAYEYGAKPAPLSAPTGVSASNGTYSDKVRITWNPIIGATHYQIFRNINSNHSGETQLTSNQPYSPFDDSSAEPGITYYYWVKACNSTECSYYSLLDSGWRRDPTSGYYTYLPLLVR